MPKIVVHEKALAHLSRGLYRSPASALRELVSNAWDANATAVLISTNHPHFMQISIRDNGDGFSQSEFEQLMNKGIGNSEKRVAEQPLIHGRPLIGRLGIGMLGIAQICGSFVVSSRPKKGTPFRAKVRLYDLIKEKLDRDDPGVVQDSQVHGVKEVDVGEYDLLPIDRDAPLRGTQITSEDVHPTFVRSFRESLDPTYAPQYTEPPLEWKAAVEVVSGVHSLRELGDYWKLLWELAASCPIPYISANAVPDGAVRSAQKRLVDYDFSLHVDNITLAKPVWLHGNKAGYTTIKIAPQEKRVYGRPLKFEGYIAVQEGSQLKPDELRGIMVRIKNVGIGYYDPSFLDYPINQGPRAKWVTGEIYVESGLEDALNVDRDSFNRFHPEFKALQQYVHGVLKNEVFPEVYRQLDKRSVAKAEERSAARMEHFKEVLTQSTERRVRVKTRKSDADHAVTVDGSSDSLDVTFGNLEQLKTRKAAKQLAAAVLAIFDVASQERTSTQQRSKFEELLLSLLRRW